VNYHSLVIVDVELCIGVYSASGLESDTHVVLADDIVEDAVTEGAVLVEYFIQDILL
jgi:hypothetical protein